MTTLWHWVVISEHTVEGALVSCRLAETIFAAVFWNGLKIASDIWFRLLGTAHSSP